MSEKIIFCGRKDYARIHKPIGLKGAYRNRKPFIKSLPRKKVVLCGPSIIEALRNAPIDLSSLGEDVVTEDTPMGKVRYIKGSLKF